jgi:hypothetical protein
MKVHTLTPKSGLLYANSPAVISQTLSSASISTPHSPAPVTAAEAPTPLLGINPTASTSASSISAPVAATRDSAASQCHSAHLVADLTAEIATVTVSGPSTRAVPSLILPNIPPKQQHGPLILLPLQQSSHLWQSSQAGAGVDGNLESRIWSLESRTLALERRMDDMEMWKLEDEEWKAEVMEWKHQMEERLRKAGI